MMSFISSFVNISIGLRRFCLLIPNAVLIPLSCLPNVGFLSKCSGIRLMALTISFLVISLQGFWDNGLVGLSRHSLEETNLLPEDLSAASSKQLVWSCGIWIWHCTIHTQLARLHGKTTSATSLPKARSVTRFSRYEWRYECYLVRKMRPKIRTWAFVPPIRTKTSSKIAFFSLVRIGGTNWSTSKRPPPQNLHHGGRRSRLVVERCCRHPSSIIPRISPTIFLRASFIRQSPYHVNQRQIFTD